MKKLMLTFDDGPENPYTSIILNLLKNEGIKATFFVVANNAKAMPEIIERMKQDGHTVALHSLEHRHPLLCGIKYMKRDFEESLKIMGDLSCNIRFYRPPWGARNLFTKKLLQKYSLKMVLWDIITKDWKEESTPEMIADIIDDKVFDGAVICLHDGGEKTGGAKGAPYNTIKALRIIIPKLKKDGYEFVTVEEFMNGQ